MRSRCRIALVWAAAVFIVGCGPPGRHELLRGKTLIEQGRPAEAIEPLKRAASLLTANPPAAAQAWNWLGLACHQAGRSSEALHAYQNALKCDFNLFAARYNLGCLLLEHTNLTGAVNEFLTYTGHQPNDPRGWLQLGTAQFRAQLYEQAGKSLQKVIELNAPLRDRAEAMNLIGMCHAAQRRPQQALTSFQAALRFQTNHPPALLNQAIVMHTLTRDRALAIQKYQAYLDAIGGPTNHPAVANLLAELESSMRPRIAVTNQMPHLSPANLISQSDTAKTNNAITTSTQVSRLGVTATSLPSAQVSALPTNIVATHPPPDAAPKTATASSKVPIASTGTPPKPTTAPLAARRPQTNLPPTVVQTPAPQTNRQPNVPLELVKLAEEVPVKTATSIQLPPRRLTPAPPAIPSNAPAPATNTAPGPVAVASKPTQSVAAVSSPAPSQLAIDKAGEPAPQKRSFFQRINPLNLLRSSPKPAPEPVRLPPQTPPPGPVPASTFPTPSPPTTVAQPPARPRPVFTRYTYSPTAMPVPGDRATAERHFSAGLLAQRSGSTAQAIRAYQEAVTADPTYFEACYNLGVAAHDATNWPIALKAYEGALVLKPNDFGTRLNFALALARAGYPVDAVNELETLSTVHPNKAEVHFAAANLYAQVLEDNQRARSHYSRVLELNPNHPQARAIRRWLLANRGD